MTVGPPPLPEEEESAWRQIVADLSGQMEFDEQGKLQLNDAPKPDPVFDELLTEGPAESDTYHPPEPPPIPRPADVVARFAWAGALGGPLLLIISTLMSMGTFISGLGVIAFIAGFVTLIARMEDRGHHDDADDNGAVV